MFSAFSALADWNLRAIRRPLLGICLALGPAELLLVLVMAALEKAQGIPLTMALHSYRAWLLPAGGMALAALMNAWQTFKSYGRPHTVYTIMTLPVPRCLPYFARVTSGLLAAGCVAVAQALWLIVLYVPFTLFSGSALCSATGEATNAFLSGGLWLNLVRSDIMHLILPTTPGNFLCAALCAAAMIASLETVATVRNWRTDLLLVISIYGAVSWYLRRMEVFGSNGAAQAGFTAIWESICLAAAVLMGVYALTMSENVPGGKVG
jgi:hypothetical protein